MNIKIKRYGISIKEEIWIENFLIACWLSQSEGAASFTLSIIMSSIILEYWHVIVACEI